MTKKRAPAYDTKPNSPSHPSLSSSGKPKDAHSLGSNTQPSGNSVNARIQQLRISQGVASTSSVLESQLGRLPSQALGSAAGPSLPPSLRSILQLPDAPSPRPRPGLRVIGRARAPAGPAPPDSWLRMRETAAGDNSRKRRMMLGETDSKIEQLPDSILPNHGSLLHTALKALAVNWDWHAHYDQHYLATIPVRCKEALLSYIARYSPAGIDKAGLALLFLDDTELEDATGVGELTHLDLSTSVGQRLKLKQLKDLLSGKKAIPAGGETSDAVPESWDTPDSLNALSGLPRFHSLTHLSLSHPTNTVTWKGLLDLAPDLVTITHLSLAYWPTPTLSPNSATAYRVTPQGNVNYGASSFYSDMDDDWTEAASILRRLSKSTYCLKWLDLTGCFPWVQALKSDLVDWCGAWRALETIKIGQGYIPECIQGNAGETAWRDALHTAGRCMNCKRVFFPDCEVSHPIDWQLIEWVDVEGATIAVEDSVNKRISESIKQASIVGVQVLEGGTVEEEEEEEEKEGFDSWGKTPSVPVSAGGRLERMTFERGWDAWWLRDEVLQFTDS